MKVRGAPDQDVRAEYVRHWLGGELVVGREYEARLCKTLLPRVKVGDLNLAERCRSCCSCVVKTVSHRKCALPCLLVLFTAFYNLCLAKLLAGLAFFSALSFASGAGLD